MSATASAPGKVMLFGEYAVLEGHPSLALCFDKRIRCTAAAFDGVQVVAPGVFDTVVLEGAASGDCPDARIQLLWPLLVAHGAGVSLEFDAEFPPVWGLGSSSASTLAASAALRSLRGDSLHAERIFTEVWHAQRSLQGAASGYDVATQLLGGCVEYRSPVAAPGSAPAMGPTHPARSVPVGESGLDGVYGPIPTAWTHDARSVPGRGEGEWLVAWTGQKAKTGDMIGRVRERFAVGHEVYGRIGALAGRAVEAWDDGSALGPLLNEGHALLDELGAVPEEIGAVVRALQFVPDVLGARLCGAGGGDCVLILAGDPEYAGRAATQRGLQLLPLRPEADGLRLEPSS